MTYKQDFIPEYMGKLTHKVEQELQEKMPNEGLFMEMINEADTIILKLLDRRRK